MPIRITHRNKPTPLAVLVIFLGSLLSILAASEGHAGPREQAKRIHDRIAGVPPSPAVLNAMEADIIANDEITAAYRAMDNDAFYNVTLKNFATPWTNRDQTVFAPLNDYSATVVGMVRDDVDFRRVLYGDILYVGSGSGIPAYSNSSNAHYEALEQQGANLRTVLDGTLPQSAITGLPASATAGIMTTRAAAKAFFYAGTNRAMYRFTMLNHLCRDLEQIKDNTRAADRVRQDVTRSPGGDSRIFLNNCVGCHTGMEPLTQAYAYYQYQYDSATDPEGNNGRLIYTPGTVQAKYLQNAETFPFGYVTPNDRWDNYWRQGINSLLGWDTALPGSGTGAKSMGQELAHSSAFARCQVEKVFKAVCLRAPGNSADRSQIDSMVNSFAASGYQMKRVFAESAIYCQGD